jgi:hypothetical protein
MIIQGAALFSRLAVFFAVLLTINACGGAGGSSFDSAEDSSGCSFFCPDDDGNVDGGDEPSVSLEALTTTEPGSLYSSAVEASDSNGATYTGTVLVTNKEQINLDGVLVTPRETITSLANQVVSATIISTSFFDDSGYLVRTEKGPVVCLVSSQAKLPESVSIGKSGSLSTLTCNNGTIEDGNWEALDAGLEGIALVLSTTTRASSDNSIVSTETTTYTLDADGVIVSFELVITELLNDSEFTLTVQSI